MERRRAADGRPAAKELRLIHGAGWLVDAVHVGCGPCPWTALEVLSRKPLGAHGVEGSLGEVWIDDSFIGEPSPHDLGVRRASRHDDARLPVVVLRDLG